jgi:hypothetical protein
MRREPFFHFFERTTHHPSHMHTGAVICACIDCGRRDPVATYPSRMEAGNDGN